MPRFRVIHRYRFCVVMNDCPCYRTCVRGIYITRESLGHRRVTNLIMLPSSYRPSLVMSAYFEDLHGVVQSDTVWETSSGLSSGDNQPRPKSRI